MEKEAPQQGKDTHRKRKRKFSDKELEILIECVTSNNDRLFGKLSLKVPEAEKRKMWLRIKDKVNACGVTHRSIDDLKKRWYDLRKRAKEKIAQRVKDADGTGGGTSNVTPNTVLEDLVESTIEREAVVGVTRLDTSGAAEGGQDASPYDSDDSARLVISETPVLSEAECSHRAEDMSSPSPPRRSTPPPSLQSKAPPPPPATILPSKTPPATTMPSKTPPPPTSQAKTPPPPTQPPPVRATPQSRRAVVPSLPLMESDHSSAPTNVPRQAVVTPTSQTSSRQRIRQRAVNPARGAARPVDLSGGYGVVEARMLRVQRLQGRHMGAMKLSMTKLCNKLSKMTDAMREHTTAVAAGNNDIKLCLQELTRAVVAGQQSERRRHRQIMLAVTSTNKAIEKLCNTTAVLSRRSVSLQVDLGHYCGDVAKALERVTTAVEQMQPGSASVSMLGAEEGSEAASSVSSVSLSDTSGRRRSGRNATATDSHRVEVEESQDKRLGVRGKRK